MAGDFLEFQRYQQRIYSDVFVRKSLASWLAHLASHPAEEKAFADGYLRQRGAVVDDMLRHAFACREVPSSKRRDFALEALSGPIFLRTLLPITGVIDEELLQETVRAALHTLQDSPAQ